MAKALQPRRLLLGIALLATVAATIWVAGREPEGDHAPVQAKPARAPTPSAASNPRVEQAPPLAALQARSASGEEIVNLFPRQSWFIPPPPPPASAPPLPFSYLGKYIDNKEIVVFLSSADQNFAVRQGDVVNGNYRIDEITPPTMTITYLPLNQKQTLEIGRAK